MRKIESCPDFSTISEVTRWRRDSSERERERATGSCRHTRELLLPGLPDPMVGLKRGDKPVNYRRFLRVPLHKVGNCPEKGFSPPSLFLSFHYFSSKMSTHSDRVCQWRTDVILRLLPRPPRPQPEDEAEEAILARLPDLDGRTDGRKEGPVRIQWCQN